MNLNLSRSLWLSILVAAGAIIPRSSLAQDAGTTPAPIPEEARKHFVMGETIFKEAKSADNFSQAATEFAQAVSLAPQFPQARYNLALAKESAGDYAGAMADLKTYQQFKLSDAEARSVQDKIYAVEAKQKMKADAAASQQAEEQKKIDYQKNFGFLSGVWRRHMFNHAYRYSKWPNAGHSDGLANISLNEKTLEVNLTYGGNYGGEWKLIGAIEGNDSSSIKWILRFRPDDTYKLPDLPITVEIDKNIPSLKWKEPGTRLVPNSGQATWWPYSELSSDGTTDLIREVELTK